MLSKSTEYALRALVCVQLQNMVKKRPGVYEIAKEIAAPNAYSAKILHTLTRHRFLYSMKGKGGGFYYPGNLCELTVYDVILLMEGDGIFKQCLIGLKDGSHEKHCPVHEEYEKVREQLFKMSRIVTIHSMALRVRNGLAVLNRLNIGVQ